MPHEEGVAAFAEQAHALKEGGVDVLWIETMSSEEELRAAVEGASEVGLPIVTTMSFDTNGRTMMGITPTAFGALTASLPHQPVAIGANCGVGASELVATVMGITAARPDAHVVAKGNCGIPQYHDGHIHYTGTPELMADYARIALDAGAKIIGGCCGTSPEHLAAMRKSLEGYKKGARPTIELIEQKLGPVSELAKGVDKAAEGASRRERRRG
jgi:5-methyltetrahydrofolate--homocysteine methyltransferase